jgi:hypothetical protein
MSKIVPLPPFKAFLASNIPSVYDNTLSYYDELTKLLAYMDKLVPAVNANTEGLKQLREYVDNYFDNLDVQEEINNKLDDMAEKGELAAIIAQFLEAAPVFAYQTISDLESATNLIAGCTARVVGDTDASAGDGAYYTVRAIEEDETADGYYKVAIGDSLIADRVINFDATKVQETAIAMTWHYSAGNVIDNYICYSNDGINWKQVKLDGFAGRDPSFVYDKKRKCFYLTKTPPANQTQTFTITKTTDFVNFTDVVMQIGGYFGEDIMAPDLSLSADGDSLIVNFTYKVEGTSTDVDGQTIQNYWPYRTVLTGLDDFENLAVDTMPIPLELIGATNDCIIDSNVITYLDKYYMNCKDDVQKIIQVYQSNDGINYTLLCANVLNAANFLDNSIYIEGGSWFTFNGEIYLMADAYSQYHNLILGKTSDFIHFDFGVTNMNYLRHPSVYTVDDEDLKTKVATLPGFGYATNDRLTAYAKDAAPARHIASGFSGEITVVPNMTYTVFGNATITNILNPFHCDKVKFMFAAASTATLNITKINGTTVNKVIVNSNTNNEKLFEISLCADVNAYPLADFQNIQVFDTSALQNYYTPDTGITITGGSAYKQGNVVSLSLILTTSAELNGYKTILTRATGASAALMPANKVIMNNESISLLDGVAMFSETGAVVGTFHNLPAGSYTISATYIAK